MRNPNNLLGLREVGPPEPTRVGQPTAWGSNWWEPTTLPGVHDGVRLTEEGRQPPAPQNAVVAPFPLIDRFPTILGSNLTVQYLSSVYRLCITGYRREYVDALDEILERDPHLFAVVTQRVLTVCGARITIAPRNADKKRHRKIADECQRQIDGIPDFRQELLRLAFSGFYYGVGSCEVSWMPKAATKNTQGKPGWEARRLHFIHSRRLNYPDPGSWDLRIWDQGQVGPFDRANPGSTKTAGIFGVRVKDFPDKFLVFTPSFRANYPTRDGLGRQVAFWSVLKTMGARGAAQFVERYCKPWAIATFATTSTGTPRAAEASATNSDIAAGNAALGALGTGSLAGAVIPDSIKLSLQQVQSGVGSLGYEQWIAICNKELSKGVLGQTDTTDGGASGSKARAETQKSGSDQLARFDAHLVASVIQQLVDSIVRLNYPDDWDKRPIVQVVVDADPSPQAVMDLVDKAVRVGMPADGAALAKVLGITLVDKDDKEAVQLAPVLPIQVGAIQPDSAETPLAPDGTPIPPADPDDPNAEPAGDAIEPPPKGDGATPPTDKAAATPPKGGKAAKAGKTKTTKAGKAKPKAPKAASKPTDDSADDDGDDVG